MGAGGAAEHGRLALDPPPPRGGGVELAAPTAVSYIGRPWRASPSEGYPTLHQREQDRIVREALGALLELGVSLRAGRARGPAA